MPSLFSGSNGLEAHVPPKKGKDRQALPRLILIAREEQFTFHP